jgi:subfamily B ATP-binding cassette protein MsbA
MKTYLRLISFAKPLGGITTRYFIFSLFSIIFGLVNFTLVIPLLNVLFGHENADIPLSEPEFYFSLRYFLDLFSYYFNQIILSKGTIGALTFIVVLLVISSFLKNAFRYLSLRIEAQTRARVVKNIRETIYYKVISLNTLFFSNQKRGDLVSRLTNDVQEVENSVVNTLTVIFREPATIIAYFVTLFMISGKLTLFTLILLPLSGIIIATVTNALRKQAKIGQETLANLMSFIDESILGIKVVKAFNAEGFMKKGFDKINHKYAHLITSMAYKKDAASPLSEFMGIMVAAGLLYYGGTLVLDSSSGLDGPKFIGFIIIFSQILAPAKALSSAFSNVQRGLASGRRILSVIDTETTILEPQQAIDLKAFEHSMSFKDVNFSYDGLNEVLHTVSFDIPKGKTVALVGPSGGGKSTIFDMIPRFIDPSSGSITIDGYNLKDINTKNLRDYIGIVTQQSILFNDSIYNNIAFGFDNVSKEDVIKAAKVANAHDFIMETPMAYDTNIGDMGNNLSGGQRQRISIARAILRNSPILILDEATSSLDTESERLVRDALEKLLKDRTSLIIAHRLSTIQHADIIIVLENGKIVEKGSHSDLMNVEGGLYKRLQSLQQD